MKPSSRADVGRKGNDNLECNNVMEVGRMMCARKGICVLTMPSIQFISTTSSH